MMGAGGGTFIRACLDVALDACKTHIEERTRAL